MNQYKIGDMVYANYGTLPLVGTVVHLDEKRQQYLVRFSAVQQLYYPASALTPWNKERAAR